MKFYVLFLVAFSIAFSTTGFAQSAPKAPQEWNVSEYVPHLKIGQEFQNDTLMFVTHAATIWDRTSAAKKGVNQHVFEALTAGVPVIYLVNDDKPQVLANFYEKYKPDYIVLSYAGAVEIKPHAKLFIFSGGFFELCLGETIRDVIAINTPSADPINAVILADSIYASNIPNNVRDTPNTPRANLALVLRQMSDAEILQYLSSHFLRNGELGQQNWAGSYHVQLKDYSFRIFRDGKDIGTLGSGKQVVNLKFVLDKDFIGN